MSDDRNYTISSSPCQQSAMTPLKRRLPPTIKTEVSPHNPLPPPLPLFQDETDSKEVDIQCCLTGASDHQSVDLIQLRELASSSGGLKTIALRRQAWPKLLASHQVLLEGPRVSRPPTSPDLRAIQRLVQRTKWSKHQITKSPKTFDELLGLMLQSEISPMRTPSITEPDSFTNRIRRVSFDLDLDDSEEPSHRQLLQLAKEERKVLRKLLIHIHRCHPDTPLYDGMQNLLAVLWIVLETPSLTSITSLQLIQFHWRPQPSDFFMRLLSLWDPILYQHFHFLGYDQTPSCIADSWIPHWFSNDLNDLEVLLRIWDLLIVSPPTTIM